MSDKLNESIKEYVDKYSNWNTKRLYKELEKEDKATHEHLSKLIAIIKILDSRGEKIPFPPYKKLLYRKLAYGEVSVRAYTKYVGTLAGRYIFQLPVKQQKHFASDGKVSIFNPEKKGVEKRPVETLSPTLLQQVFCRKGIRTPEEQKDYYEKVKNREKNDGLFVDSTKRQVMIRIKGRVKRYDFEEVKQIFDKAGFKITIKSK